MSLVPASAGGVVVTPVADAALEYVQRGWKVIPIDPATKEPARWNGTRLGIRSATANPETIRHWFAKMPDAGVAIVCRASGLAVIDADLRHHADLCAVDRLIGDVPTFTVDTPDGMHRYYQDPGLPKLRGKLDEARFPGHDIKLDGYAIAPPTVRADGGRYEILTDDDPAPIPDALLAEVRLPERPPSLNGDSPPIDADALGVPPMRELLLDAGWSLHSEHGEETWWTRPGKDPAEGVSATHNHLGTDTLKVFTTSTVLPTDGTLTRFGVYAYLNHGGEFRAARQHLSGDDVVHAAEPVVHDGEHDVQERDHQACALPDGFWTARPAFAHIRQAAQSSGVSAELTLGVVLGRVAAASPHTIEIPGHVGAPCGLSMIVMGVGPPGASKTAAVRNGINLVPAGLIEPKVDGIGPGSGEGLIEVLFEPVLEPDPQDPDKKIRVRRQTRFNAFLYGDEAEAVIRQSQRQSSGSTFLANVRSIFSAAPSGKPTSATTSGTSTLAPTSTRSSSVSNLAAPGPSSTTPAPAPRNGSYGSRPRRASPRSTTGPTIPGRSTGRHPTLFSSKNTGPFAATDSATR